MNIDRQKRAFRLLQEAFPDIDSVAESVMGDVDVLEAEDEMPPHLSTVKSAIIQKTPGAEIRAIVNPLPDAIDKAKNERELSDGELMAMEAVIALYSRPALLVQNDDFLDPPVNWAMLAFKRQEIRTVLPSVGRIEFPLPGLDHIGSGFLVGDELVMTNRHVAKNFSRFKDGKWQFLPYISTQIDYKEEKGSKGALEFRILEVLGVHEMYDIALLKVAPQSVKGKSPPLPLRIMAARPEEIEGSYVYVVGYPAKDAKRNDPQEMERIFKNIYNCKRLQPGILQGCGIVDHKGAPKGDVLLHDCSTLGGNSGSCVIDLRTGLVIGLHYGGFFGQNNYAVPLWMLSEDPFLRQYGVNFHEI